jgi:lipoprotein-releasing system permease protein
MSPERINRLMVPLIVLGESGIHMNEVMIGSGLAKRLTIAPGDTLIVYSSDELRETPRVFQCRVGAVIQCGMTSYDESVVVFDRRMLAQWLRIDTSSASSILVTSTNREGVAARQRMLQQALGQDVIVLTYEDSFATVSSWIELQREPIPIILGLISLVAGLTMISTLLIAVVEKSRSIAILITLGMSPVRAGLIFVTRAVAMSVTGSLIGLALAITALVIQREWQVITLERSALLRKRLTGELPDYTDGGGSPALDCSGRTRWNRAHDCRYARSTGPDPALRLITNWSTLTRPGP